jgi:hypothetical protein
LRKERLCPKESAVVIFDEEGRVLILACDPQTVRWAPWQVGTARVVTYRRGRDPDGWLLCREVERGDPNSPHPQSQRSFISSDNGEVKFTFVADQYHQGTCCTIDSSSMMTLRGFILKN